MAPAWQLFTGADRSHQAALWYLRWKLTDKDIEEMTLSIPLRELIFNVVATLETAPSLSERSATVQGAGGQCWCVVHGTLGNIGIGRSNDR